MKAEVLLNNGISILNRKDANSLNRGNDKNNPTIIPVIKGMIFSFRISAVIIPRKPSIKGSAKICIGIP